MTPSIRSLACVPPSNVPARGSIDTVGGISSASPQVDSNRPGLFFFFFVLFAFFIQIFTPVAAEHNKADILSKFERRMLTIPFVVPERMLQWAAQRGFIEFEYECSSDNRFPVAVV